MSAINSTVLSVLPPRFASPHVHRGAADDMRRTPLQSQTQEVEIDIIYYTFIKKVDDASRRVPSPRSVYYEKRPTIKTDREKETS